LDFKIGSRREVWRESAIHDALSCKFDDEESKVGIMGNRLTSESDRW